MQIKFSRRNLKWWRTVYLLIALILVYPLNARLEAKTTKSTYVVIGTSMILQENVTAARERAIASSLVSALGLVAAEFMAVDTLVENYDSLNRLLYDQTTKYIQDYKVLTETASEKVYRVMVQVTVADQRVKNQLAKAGFLMQKAKMPRVLFYIAEQTLKQPAPQYWWGKGMSFVTPTSEAAIADAMRKKGMKVIAHGPRVQQEAFGSIADIPEISREEATSFGTAMKADVVIIGTAIADNAPNTMGSGLRSFKGVITTHAYRTKSGDEIASMTRTAVTVNSSESAGSRDALTSAGSLVAEELVAQVLKAWQREGQKPSQVELLLSGTGNLANFVMFRRMLASISGVEEVQVKEIKGEEASLGVEYKDSSEKLASALMLHAFDTFGINIYEVTPEYLRIELTPNNPSAIH